MLHIAYYLTHLVFPSANYRKHYQVPCWVREILFNILSLRVIFSFKVTF